jgi:hypothetical protein
MPQNRRFRFSYGGGENTSICERGTAYLTEMSDHSMARQLEAAAVLAAKRKEPVDQ